MTRDDAIQALEKCRVQIDDLYLRILAILNERGQQGWEAVNAMHHKDAKGNNVWTALLKRPSVGPMPPADEQPATPTASEPTDQAAGEPDQSQGFDLSEKEFELKKP